MKHASRAKFRISCIQLAIVGASLTSATTTFAQTSPLETITVTAPRHEDTAVGVAPTMAPLESIQPTSVLSQDYIQKNLPMSGNYDEAIAISPSVFDTAPNGPGLAESQNISIRGFQDGQFNVTFDGIPWQDANDFTHHSTSYFMAHDLGQISVDRGPGTAATIGNATFGGTVALLSRAPRDDMSVTPYVSYGSFDTILAGAELDSGTIDDTGGTRIILDGEGLRSDGYLTNMTQKRRNITLKIVQPLGSNTTVTLTGMYNSLYQGISLGATRAQINTLGPNWALSKDPTNQNFEGYNLDRITTDFEYVDVESDWGDGWSSDAKIYTYAYFHHGLNGEDPNGWFPNGTVIGGPGGTNEPNDVPGQALTNNYRSIGTIARLTKEFSFGDIKAGIWYDRQINKRALFEVDLTKGYGVLNYATDTGVVDPITGLPNATDRNLHQTLTTIQPYFQIDWTPIENLTISPGVKYDYFDRSVNPIVDVKTGFGNPYDLTFDAILPSVIAHYTIDPDWTAYAQVAEGFLAPNENFFNTKDPSSTTLAPQKTWNYQAGTTVQMENLAISGDAYYIDFSNLINGIKKGGNVTYSNLGGVIYQGLEGEVTYLLGDGFSLYANGSLNSAKNKTSPHYWIPNAPETTWALGAIYDHEGLYASIIGKYIGARFGDVNQTQGLSPLFTMDASFGYDLGRLADVLKETQLQLQVYNLTDTTKIDNLLGYTVGNNPTTGNPDATYWTQPGRSVFVSLSKTF